MNLLGMKRKLLPLGNPQGGKGGGGGGQPPPPASQTVTQTSIPEYARPYVETMLGKTEALTDINQNPYQSYGGQRIAGFNPVQERAFADVQNRQTSSQLGTGTALAGVAGLGALGAGSNYQSMATDPNALAAYMSPYMQNAVDVQKNEAFRDAQIRNLGANLGSVRQGSYGGARQALGEQERNRNLQNTLGQIQAGGSQKAFEAAQQAQQFGTNAGLQGFGQAGQAAATLGNLGQTQFGQQSAINQAQQQVGAIQQAQAQQSLDLGYQDFLKQRNYPYQQLAFMSDMTRGIPLSQSAQQVYTAPPSTASQLGGLGMSALGIYGASGGFKGAEGGPVKMAQGGVANAGLMAAKAFKTGGLNVGDITMMSVEQLTEMLDNPSLDPLEVAAIEQRIMLLNRMGSNPTTAQIMSPGQQYAGIDSIPTGDMVPEQMAGGGIIAFSKGGKSEEDYRTFLESQVRKSIENQMSGNAFNKSAADKAAIEQDNKERKENRMYETLARIGAGTAAGTSQYGLSNLGAGVNEGVKAYSQMMDKDTADRMKLLDAQLYADKAEDARRSSLTGQMNTTLGQMYAKDAALAAARASAGDPETKLLAKAQALVNNDPVIKGLVRQQKDSGAAPGSPDYQYYEDRISERNSQIFTFVGLKPPPIQESKVKPPAAPVKEPSFLDRINPFSSSKPAATQNKVVPFNQLPT